MTVRTVDIHHPEWPLIRDKLPALCRRVALATEVKTGIAPSPDRIKRSIDLACLGHEDNFVLVTAGPCLVGYTIGQPWWGDLVALSEEFIVRYKPGNFADTIKDLEQHASSLMCTALVISSLAMIRQESYGNYLKRKGFREVSREYMKGLDNG
jgi:hypothetical protein